MSPARAGQLHRREHVHRDAGRADRVAFGLEPARGIDRQPAVLLRSSPRARRARPARAAVRPIASYSISSAMVKQSWVSTKSRSSSPSRASRRAPLPGLGAALEQRDVAPAHRQEVVDLDRGAEHHRLVHARARSRRRSAPARRRRRRPASSRSASSGPATSGFLSDTVAAELEAQVLVHLRQRIGAAVLVVLGGDRRERVALVAVASGSSAGRSGRTRRRSRPRSPPSSLR